MPILHNNIELNPIHRLFALGSCVVLLSALSIAARAEKPDFSTPEMRKIRQDYQQQTERHTETRRQELEKLVQDNLDWANAQLEENTRSGNITGTAIARVAIRIFETCAEEMKNKGDFAIPERVRRELTERVQTLETNKKNIEAKYDIILGPLRDRFFYRFSDLAQEQIGRIVAETQMREWFDQLIEGSAPPPPLPAPDAQPGEEAKPDAPPLPELPDVLASSGHADDWVTVGHWFANVNALELIRIPVMRIAEDRKHSGKGDMSGASYEMLFRPQRVLQPGDGLVFRIKSVKGRLGADVVEWPSVRNRWTLYLRVRPIGTTTSSHGIELQVNADATFGAVAAQRPTADGAKPEPTPAQPVKISVKSAPPGAEVHVDGERQTRNNVPLKTPCDMTVIEGPREIRLTLFGYVDGVIKDFEAKPGAVAEWTFVKDRAMEKFTVRAFARTGWRGSRIRVNKGDRLTIASFGQWSCGEGRENTDGDGYPRQRFPQYYQAPHGDRRLIRNANYGALLMRIGEDGPVGVIGARTLQMVAPADGELYFGINEAPAHLRDNSGGLTLQIQKSSGGS